MRKPTFLVIGAGFAGLSAAHRLASAGFSVSVLEADATVGGLAGAFETGGERLDRFYHHWFTSDKHVLGLIDSLGLQSEIVSSPTNTGVYYANKIFKLSTPLDLLKFEALPFLDRLRLGFFTLRVRAVKDWAALEYETAAAWLRRLGGYRVFKVVWEPLLKGKFGPYAEEISAVWFWNKLKLRGGSRGSGGEERLLYLKGSFARLADSTASAICSLGGVVHTHRPVERIERTHDGCWTASGTWGQLEADRLVVTTALPLFADMIKDWAETEYLQRLRRIQYLANLCLVLRLDRSLSSTYWLNVNDTSFPYVGVIEHTNFEHPDAYGGDHVVYLSKYLPVTDQMYAMSDQEVFEYSLPYLKRMFPLFESAWVRKFHVWRARWAQPVVERNYSKLIPGEDGPAPGLHICSMAQIYPEDRGTNYAIRQGVNLAERLIAECSHSVAA
jgi:protoporphyrinogen oxidase